MSAAKALSSEASGQVVPEVRPSEPTMDDILASIRRIIADDQSRHATAALRRQPSPPPIAASPPARAAVDRLAASPPGRQQAASAPTPIKPVAAATAAPPPVSSRLQPAPATAVSSASGAVPHVSPPSAPILDFDRTVIDEIASAGVASALQVSTASPVGAAPQGGKTAHLGAAPPPIGTAPQPGTAPRVVATRSAAVPRLEATIDRATRVIDLADIASAPVIEMEATPTQIHAQVHATQAEPEVQAALADADFEDADLLIEELVSATAGASIESSFHALATSIFIQNTGGMDGMMREMLRPMLKTWLDDNLPTIVERLVRNEIERVARGARG